MTINDDKLDKLLQSWHNVEPSSSFEASVRRRIRALPAGQTNTLSFGSFLFEQKVIRPAYAAAAALLIGIAVGLTGGLVVPIPSRQLHNNLFKPLPERSLSASYVQLVGGEKP